MKNGLKTSVVSSSTPHFPLVVINKCRYCDDDIPNPKALILNISGFSIAIMRYKIVPKVTS
jgi:hypothetical protein